MSERQALATRFRIANACRSEVAPKLRYSHITISFDEEPGEYRWRVKPLSDEIISIQILEFDELWGDQPDEEGKTIFSVTCRLRTFCGAVLSASQKVFEQYGLEGYKAKWVEYDFPLNRQQELQRLMQNK